MSQWATGLVPKRPRARLRSGQPVEGKRKEREDEKEDMQDIANEHYCFVWPENIGTMK